MNTISKWLTALSLASVSILAYAQQYTVTDLNTTSFADSFAAGISSNGEVTGSVSSPGAGNYVFLYRNGTMTNLGIPGGGFGDANASGQVVGYACRGSTCAPEAFLYSNGALTYIAGTTGNSFAFSINDSGTVVGFDTSNNDSATPFIYQNGSLSHLSVLGSAQSINNSGQVAGYGSFPNGEQAFIYSNGIVTPLGTPSGTFSYGSFGYGLNNLGQVVGWSNSTANAGNVQSQGFFYTNGKMNSIGALSGPYDGSNFLYAVNDAGQAVGNANTPSGSANVALLYADGQLFNLNSLTTGPSSSYVTLTLATGINDLGQIVADGIDSRTGNTNAYLLTPVAPTIACPAANAQVGVPYSSTLTAAAGFPPYQFSILKGNLPPVLTLNGSTGAITGTPSTAAAYSFTAKVVDSSGLAAGTAASNCAITVSPLPVSSQLSALLGEVTNVGPGDSLAAKVMAAQADYSVGNTQRTCAVLTALVHEVAAQNERKIGQKLDAKIIKDTQTIESGIDCK